MRKHKVLKWIRAVLGMMILTIAIKLVCNYFTKPVERQPAATGADPECRVCYLLNIDGMKGLGHSALLLIEENGSAQIFSYNGMQYDLRECLMGKAGVGKMRQLSMDADDLAYFFQTGVVPTDSPEECDNFDRAFYHGITRGQYEKILDEIQYYIEIGNEFERLYAENPREADAFARRDDIPKYRIYTHNCDTVARELMAAAFDEVKEYNGNYQALTPGGNYRKLCQYLGDEWGVLKLGEDSFIEKILSDY